MSELVVVGATYTNPPPPPPSGTLLNYQYQFRSLVFGAGTDYRTEVLRGLLSLPSVRSSDSERQDDHGSFGGLDLMGNRIIDGTMWFEGSAGTDIEAKAEVLREIFTVGRKSATVAEPFYFRRPGLDLRMVLVKCRARNIDSDYELAKGLGRCDFQLVGTDPLIYSTVEKSSQIVLATNALTGSATFTNDGDYVDGASPVITIGGPATNPRIANAADGNRQIKIDIVLGAGDTLEIDTQRKTVTLNPATTKVNRYDAVRADSQWFALLPGANVVSYSRASGNVGSSSTLTLKFKDTYQ